MNLFGNNATSMSVEGYVTKKKKPIPAIFPVERVIRMQTFLYQGKYYFRTRDAAALLGLKQPFQFTADCKKHLGEYAILKGDRTKPFRTNDDTDQVTFIEALDLLNYLRDDSTFMAQKFAYGMYDKVVAELVEMVD